MLIIVGHYTKNILRKSEVAGSARSVNTRHNLGDRPAILSNNNFFTLRGFIDEFG